MHGIKLIDNYLVTRELNKGKENVMYEAIDQKANKLVVIKSFPTYRFKEKRKLELFKRELKLLSSFNHLNIVKLHSLKKTENYYYLIIEYCNGGKLSEYLEYYQKTNKKALSEGIVQKILKQLLNGLSYMHNCNTMHRDIRIETIQLDFPSIPNNIQAGVYPSKINYDTINIDSPFIVKIADLSIARELDDNGVASTICGAPLFMAPDIFLNKQDKKNDTYHSDADLWSLGVMTYTLLVGKPPFNASDMTSFTKQLNEGNYSFPKNCQLSYEAMSFIDGLLQLSPDDRMKWNDIKEHPFIMYQSSTFHYIKEISKPIQLNIKNKDNLKWLQEKTLIITKNAYEKESKEEKSKKEEEAKALKELNEIKKKLAAEKANIEKEKEMTVKIRIENEKSCKAAEQLKKKTEAEQLKLKQDIKNKKEKIEEELQQEIKQKINEEIERQKEFDKIYKEKAYLVEEEQKNNRLKYEADQMLKNAERIKQEIKQKNNQIIHQKEIEEKKRIEEEKQRELRENSRKIEENKLLEDFKQKELGHNQVKTKLEAELNALRELAHNLLVEAEEKKKMQKALEDKEKEQKKMQAEIEKIMNENDKKIKQIEQEKQKRQLLIDQEHQRQEQEVLNQKEIALNNNIIQKEKEIQQMQINQMFISIEAQNKLNQQNQEESEEDWECLSCKSMELGKDVASDFLIINEYQSSKANI